MDTLGFRNPNRNGFTAFEMIVMLAIITILSIIVLASFSGVNEGQALNRGTFELALGIRKAQNSSLSTLKIVIGDPPVPPAIIPKAVGVHLSTVATGGLNRKFFLFADTNLNGRYDGTSEKIQFTETTFPGNVYISQIWGPTTGNRSTAFPTFRPPEATVTIMSDAGETMGDRIEITLSISTGQTKKIIIRESGQINIQ